MRYNSAILASILKVLAPHRKRGGKRGVLTFDLTQSTPPGDMSELLNECSVAWAEFRPRKRSVR